LRYNVLVHISVAYRGHLVKVSSRTFYFELPPIGGPTDTDGWLILWNVLLGAARPRAHSSRKGFRVVAVENKPGTRRPTLSDVAAAAGVSVALVSIVMRDVPGASMKTRERVRQIADGLGYRPDQRARLLRQQHSRLIGVTFEIEQAFHGDLVKGLYTAAESIGYDLVLSAVAAGRPEAHAVQAVLDDRCEAVIMVGPRSPTRKLNKIAAKLPLVTVARNVRSTAVDCVRTDDRAGMASAIEHLVTLGHRHIAYLAGGTAAGAGDRLRALRTAATKNGVDGTVVILPSGPVEEDGAAATHALLEQAPHITAVVAFNDRCAVGVMDTLLRAGLRVPQDMSVIGYDDSRLSRISYIDLTTVGQNPDELAATAVRRVTSRVENKPEGTRDQIITPELIIRTTTGAPADRHAGRRRQTAQPD
jgi:DNA-binding LacI/PurR family transcriptional regulator